MCPGEPLHRLREFGCILKECDLIDESLITSEQMKVLTCFLIGDGNVRQFPCPDMNWNEFQMKIKVYIYIYIYKYIYICMCVCVCVCV